jgi:hypothetical protein
MKKRKKYELFKVSLIIGILLITFLLGFFLHGLLDKSNSTIKQVMSSVDEIISYNMNLSYTQQVFERCSDLENASEKFYCMNKFVIENYNSQPREDIYSIDDLFDYRADCKSYAVYYATLSKMMGYDYLFVQLPTHIFTISYFDEGYCVLDERFAQCSLYGENLNNSEVNE